MSAQVPADYLTDYLLLRAPVGCGIDEVKRCYRREVRDLHPDRHPELANDPQAQEVLQRLTVAYRRLVEYHKVHGRMPGSRDRPTVESTRPAAVLSPAPGRMWGRVLAAVAVVGASAWTYLASHDPVEPGEGVGLTASVPAEAIASEPSAAMESRPFRRALLDDPDRGIRRGDPKMVVRAILGPPILASEDAWEYGPSHVQFRNGIVVGWYNSPLKPLHVDPIAERDEAANDQAD